jgi:hypothetical protein
MKNDFIQRVIIDRDPSPRDRWKMLHRLWRIACKGSARPEGGDADASDCLFTIFCNSPKWLRMYRLLKAEGDKLETRRLCPTFLRKMLLDSERRLRLRTGHPEWYEQDQVTAQKVRDSHGYEVTPDEVAGVRRNLLDVARSTARVMNVWLPIDDQKVLDLLKNK